MNSLKTDNKFIKYFDDLDHAIEESEVAILNQNAYQRRQHRITLEYCLTEIGGKKDNIDALMSYFERIEMKAGQYLFKEHDPSDELYYLEQGMVDVLLTNNTGAMVRLRKMGMGTILGEMSLFLADTRFATVKTTEHCILYKLTKASLLNIQKDNPHAAYLLYHFIITQLSTRLSYTNIQLNEQLSS